jgi:thiol-disulfide isomerase/thioredoxin/YHS domain-containing protein
MKSTSLTAALLLAVCISSPTVLNAQIQWRTTIEAAQRESIQTGKPVMIHFFGDNCPPCRILEAKTFPDPTLASTVNNNVIAVKINAESDRRAADQYDVTRWPMDVFLFPSGEEAYRTVSNRDPAVYTQIVQRVALRNRDWVLAYNKTGEQSPNATSAQNVAAVSNARPSNNPPASNPYKTVSAPMAKQNEAAAGRQADMQRAAKMSEQNYYAQSATQPSAPTPGVAQTNPYAAVAQQSPVPNPNSPSQPNSNRATPSGATGNPFALQAPGSMTNSSSVQNPFAKSDNSPQSPTAAVFNPPIVSAANASASVNRYKNDTQAAVQPANQPTASANVARNNAPGTTPNMGSQIAADPTGNVAALTGNPAVNPAGNTDVFQRPACTNCNDPNCTQCLATPANNPSTMHSVSYAEPNRSANTSPIAPQTPAANPELCFDGYCPVTLKQTMNWKAGNEQFAVRHRGRIYYCMSEQARQQFLLEPDRFAPVLSGYDLVEFLKTGQLIPGRREFGCMLGSQEAIYVFATKANQVEFENAKAHYLASLQSLTDANSGGRVATAPDGTTKY